MVGTLRPRDFLVRLGTGIGTGREAACRDRTLVFRDVVTSEEGAWMGFEAG